MPVRTDVLIVGAGPAGALAALLLARAGVRVRLLDRSRFPRPKLCGDTINPGALAILRRAGVAPAIEAVGRPMAGMLISGPGGAQVVGRYPEPSWGLSLWRAQLDWMLVQHAIAAGASFEPETRVDGALIDAAGRVVGVRATSTTGARGDFRATLTMAADGRRSTLAFGLGLARHPRRPRRWAIGGYFDAGAAHTDLGEMHLRHGAYFGVAPLPDGTTNACLVIAEPAPGSLRHPRARLEATLRGDPVVGHRFAGARLIGDPVVMGPLAVNARRSRIDGLLLAGDAAGFLDPMTGDGLRFAFRGAEMAVTAALELLGGRAVDPVGTLERRRQRAFGRKWRLNRALRALVGSPRALSAATVAGQMWPSVVRRLVVAAGDVGAE